MFKLIRRLIGIAIIAALVFLALSLWQGGKPFRWLGEKSEQAGEVIKRSSEEAGEKADKLKKKTDDIRGTTQRVGEGLKKTGEKIKEFTNSKERN